MKLKVFILAVLIAILVGCGNGNQDTTEQLDQTMPDIEEPTIDDSIAETEEKYVIDENGEEQEEERETLTAKEQAQEIVQLLKEQDMRRLSTYVHPSKGLLFSPYSYVDKEEDLVFQAEEVAQLMSDDTVYTWGVFDGKGNPIEMTFQEYYERFVYDVDFVNAEEVSVNEQISSGNTIDNSQEAFPDAEVVEFHFSGFDPDYAGMDWRSLRVVLEMEDDQWYIVAIIHDEWTI
ncbi:MAG: hypothetical protein LRY71_15590 [Bacillaceae bacterium]|nr:hypothetical protein [Bacillaceae bacterium]